MSYLLQKLEKCTHAYKRLIIVIPRKYLKKLFNRSVSQAEKEIRWTVIYGIFGNLAPSYFNISKVFC